jgi:hypothetical protein
MLKSVVFSDKKGMYVYSFSVRDIVYDNDIDENLSEHEVRSFINYIKDLRDTNDIDIVKIHSQTSNICIGMIKEGMCNWVNMLNVSIYDALISCNNIEIQI